MVDRDQASAPLTRRQMREAERAAAERAERSVSHVAPERTGQSRSTHVAHAAWDPRPVASPGAGHTPGGGQLSGAGHAPGAGYGTLPGVPSRSLSRGPDGQESAARTARRPVAAPTAPAASPAPRAAAAQHTPSWVPTERRSVSQPPVTRGAAATGAAHPSGASLEPPASPEIFVAPEVPVAPAVFVAPASPEPASRVAPTTAIASPAALAAPATPQWPATSSRRPAPRATTLLSDETVVLDAFVALDEPVAPEASIAAEEPVAASTPAPVREQTPAPVAVTASEAAPVGAVAAPRAATAPRVVARGGDEQRSESDHVVRAQARTLARAGRKAVRFGVVGALAAVTVAVPLGRGSLGSTDVLSGLPSDHGTLPTTVSALTAMPLSVSPPASLTTVDSAILDARGAELASRDASRQPIPGCDPSARPAGENGRLARGDLCALWDGHTQMRADAASALAELNAVYVARFGADMCLASGYRTLQEQYSVKARKGGLAAPPGKSNHGWGLAVDFCSAMTSGARWTWLNENAGTYGFENPEWARPGGSGPYERWHWEYTKGVMADGEYYG